MYTYLLLLLETYIRDICELCVHINIAKWLSPLLNLFKNRFFYELVKLNYTLLNYFVSPLPHKEFPKRFSQNLITFASLITSHLVIFLKMFKNLFKIVLQYYIISVLTDVHETLCIKLSLISHE